MRAGEDDISLLAKGGEAVGWANGEIVGQGRCPPAASAPKPLSAGATCSGGSGASLAANSVAIVLYAILEPP